MKPIRQQLEELSAFYEYPTPTVDVDRVRRRNEEFIKNSGICATEGEYRWFIKIDNAQVSSMAYCRESEEIAQFGADLIAWLFLFDDKIGEGPNSPTITDLEQRLAGFLAVCRTGEVQDQQCKFQHALLALVMRGAAMGGTTWQRKFARSFEWYFNGLLGEYRGRYLRERLGLEEYRRVRRQSIAGYPIMDLLDLSVGRVVDHPEIEQLRHQTADMLGWVNDLCSTDKEGLDDDPINLVNVVAKDFGLPLEAAFAQAVTAVHNPDWQLFRMRQAKILASDADDAVKSYALSLQKWVEATYHWSFRSRRYTDIYNDRLNLPVVPGNRSGDVPLNVSERSSAVQ